MSAPRIALITPRQRDIISELIADGANNAEIAERLGVGRETVRSQFRHIYAAANVPTREKLLVEYFRNRLRFQLKRQPL